MTPVQSEIYNIASGANGLTSGQLHRRAKLPIDRKETVQAVHDMVRDGKLIGLSVEGQRLYIAATFEHKAALDAQAEKKAEKAPPPARDIKGRQPAPTKGVVAKASETIRQSGVAAAVASASIKPKAATESKTDQETAAIRAAYAEAFAHGMAHACACMAGVTDMPRERAIEHYWQISQAGRKERAA